VLCWDERWVFLEQRFETLAGELVALGIVKAVLTAQRRTLRPREALKTMGMLRRSPAMPPAVKAWALAEEWMAEPRGAPAPPELEELAEPAKPDLAALASAVAEPAPAEQRAGRFMAWRRKAASAPVSAAHPVPAPAAPEVLAELPALPPPEPDSIEAPEPPPGRFGQWRRRRAS
jgi:hypothetical protein